MLESVDGHFSLLNQSFTKAAPGDGYPAVSMGLSGLRHFYRGLWIHSFHGDYRSLEARVLAVGGRQSGYSGGIGRDCSGASLSGSTSSRCGANGKIIGTAETGTGRDQSRIAVTQSGSRARQPIEESISGQHEP